MSTSNYVNRSDDLVHYSVFLFMAGRSGFEETVDGYMAGRRGDCPTGRSGKGLEGGWVVNMREVILGGCIGFVWLWRRVLGWV